jgi:alcohol dehydrogenase (cytochrome c)
MGGAPVRGKFTLVDGRTIEGLVLGRTAWDLQLRTDDQRIHLFRAEGERFRPVTTQADWSTYHGSIDGNRYSKLAQIDTKNVSRLAPKWVFSVPNAGRLQTTPIVHEGILYMANINACYALDAGSGKLLWSFQRPRTAGLVGNAAGGINRGVAIAGDRLFMVTDHAHLLALNRFTGEILWDTEMADWRQNYNATSAPLIVGNMVISGTAGGEEGVRGFLAAFDQQTGKEVWRFWTIPKPGEPGSETWVGKDIEHGGATTWLTGTYDPELNTVYWPTGNAGPDFNGDNRLGDNLYACSIVALDATTGKLKWYYQYTPHDEWDWDAQQPPVLVDTAWEGRPRKLLLHANRNGFFYVLDRTNGKLLLAKPLVKNVTWAKEIGPDGRPVMNPNQVPSTEGALVCPAVEGATNWFSTSYNPATKLYYVQTLEKCAIYTKRPAADWQAGRGYRGGGGRQTPEPPPQKILRAIDIQTGKFVWELPQTGPANSWGGALSTAGGLVFFGDDSGALAAADASTGKRLWHYIFNEGLRASPITYQFDNKQYVAIAAGGNLFAFALVE